MGFLRIDPPYEDSKKVSRENSNGVNNDTMHSDSTMPSTETIDENTHQSTPFFHQSTPLVQEKTPFDINSAVFNYIKGVGWSEEQGRRPEMEDGMCIIQNWAGQYGAWFFAIYDGHGGRNTVDFLVKHLHGNIWREVLSKGWSRKNQYTLNKMTNSPNETQYEPTAISICTNRDIECCIKKAFIKTDQQILKSGILESGSTACVCIIRPKFHIENVSSVDNNTHQKNHNGSLVDHSNTNQASNTNHVSNTNNQPGDNNNNNKTKGNIVLSLEAHIAHLGDSRVLLVYLDSSYKRLTHQSDHKASAVREIERIENLGGWVMGERVNGMLAIGRAFGDWNIKHKSLNIMDHIHNANMNQNNNISMSQHVQSIIRNILEKCNSLKNENDITCPLLVSHIPDICTEELLSYHHHPNTHQMTHNEENNENNEEDITYAGNSCDKSKKSDDLTPTNMINVKMNTENTMNDCEYFCETFQPIYCKPNAEFSSIISNTSKIPALLVLGCDGLFDVFSDSAVSVFCISLVRYLSLNYPELSSSEASEIISRALIEESISIRGSTDNISIIIIIFQPMEYFRTHFGNINYI